MLFTLVTKLVGAGQTNTLRINRLREMFVTTPLEMGTDSRNGADVFDYLMTL
jgi:hypothetical protein